MVHRDRLRYLELRPALSCKRAIVVYDIGAHHGEFASLIAHSRNVSAIYCFEPVSRIFVKLVERTEQFKKVQCFRIALGGENSICRIHVNDFTPSSSILRMTSTHVEEYPFTRNSHKEEVQMVTLDEAVQMYGLAPPDFIKIDVQGYEDRVIQGGANIVNKAKYCMIELSLVNLYEEGMLITDMNSLMRNLGFRLVGIIGKNVGRSGEILQLDGLYKNEKA
jgi:FkbM family methyltransferase